MMASSLDLSSLRHALTSLEGSLSIVENLAWFNQQSPIIQNTLIAGVIQNFEFVYEISYKMIKRQLELDSGSPTEVDESNFRDVLRAAAEKGLITDVTTWFTYRNMRNITAHTYDQHKAHEVYKGALVFVQDARALLTALEARNA